LLPRKEKQLLLRAAMIPRQPKACSSGHSAVQGGGFGIVVEMKMEVQKLQSKNGYVVGGRYTWYPKPDELLAAMNHLYTANWPDRMTMDSSWLCNYQQQDGKIGVRFLFYYIGNGHDFEKHINRFVVNRELSKQLKRRSQSEKSTHFPMGGGNQNVPSHERFLEYL
jgi:hypothetical protein